MNKLKNFVTSNHLKTKRNYLERMKNNKIYCMKIAKKFEKDYWDGKRSFGYGGYKYIKNYWTPIAKKLIKNYKLSNHSKILDIGCGKAFLLYEIKKLLPEIKILGTDISDHALKNSPTDIRKYLIKKDASKSFTYRDNHFDLVISLATLHNFELFDLVRAIKEIERVGKKKFIMVESYRTDLELFNLQCWALTCQTFFSKKEWIYLFKELKYKGDYEFIYFK